jgi:hypothetical protein
MIGALVAPVVASDADPELNILDYVSVYRCPPSESVALRPCQPDLIPTFVPVLLNGVVQPGFRRPSAETLPDIRQAALTDAEVFATFLVVMDQSLNWTAHGIGSIELAMTASAYTDPGVEMSPITVRSWFPTVHTIGRRLGSYHAPVLFSSSLAASPVPAPTGSVLGVAALALTVRVRGVIFPTFIGHEQLFVGKLYSFSTPTTPLPVLDALTVRFAQAPVSAHNFDYGAAFDTDDDEDDEPGAAPVEYALPVRAGRPTVLFQPHRTSSVSSPAVAAGSGADPTPDEPLMPTPVSDPSSLVRTLPYARTSRDGTKERLFVALTSAWGALPGLGDGSIYAVTAAESSGPVSVAAAAPAGNDAVDVAAAATLAATGPFGLNVATTSFIVAPAVANDASAAAAAEHNVTVTLYVPSYMHSASISVDSSTLPVALTINVCGRSYDQPEALRVKNEARTIVLTAVTVAVMVDNHRSAVFTYVKACEHEAKMSGEMFALTVIALIFVLGAVIGGGAYFLSVVRRGQPRRGVHGETPAERIQRERELREYREKHGTWCPWLSGRSAQQGRGRSSSNGGSSGAGGHGHGASGDSMNISMLSKGELDVDSEAGVLVGRTLPGTVRSAEGLSANAGDAAAVGSFKPPSAAGVAVSGAPESAARGRGDSISDTPVHLAGRKSRAAAPSVREPSESEAPVVIRGGRKSRAAAGSLSAKYQSSQPHDAGGIPTVPNMPETKSAKLMLRLQGEQPEPDAAGAGTTELLDLV